MNAASTASSAHLPLWRWGAALMLGLVGFAASVATLYASPIEGVTDLGCGRVFDCSEALGSQWGKVAGIPLGVFGGFYFALWSLTLLAWKRSPARDYQAFLTLIMAPGLALSFIFLLLLSFVVEGNCVYCLITHAANIGAAALLWPLHARPRCDGRLAGIALPLLVVAFLVGFFLFQLYENRVARATEKAKEQTIW